jgi:hypothetical protein
MNRWLLNPMVWIFGLPVAAFVVIVLMVGVSLVVNRIWPGSLDPKPGAKKKKPAPVKARDWEPTAGRYFYDDFGDGGAGM